METGTIEGRIARLEASVRAWRIGFVVIAALMAVFIAYAGLREPPAAPRVDARALDSLLKAIYEQDAGCAGRSSSAPRSFDEFRRGVMSKFESMLARDADKS